MRRDELSRFCQEANLPEHELQECLEDGHLVIEDEQARYGQFEELETLCRELGLAYVRRSDGKYEFSPELVAWVPGMEAPLWMLADHEGHPMVAMDDVRAIREALRRDDPGQALELAEAAVIDLPAIPPFTVV